MLIKNKIIVCDVLRNERATESGLEPAEFTK